MLERQGLWANVGTVLAHFGPTPLERRCWHVPTAWPHGVGTCANSTPSSCWHIVVRPDGGRGPTPQPPLISSLSVSPSQRNRGAGVRPELAIFTFPNGIGVLAHFQRFAAEYPLPPRPPRLRAARGHPREPWPTDHTDPPGQPPTPARHPSSPVPQGVD